MCVSICHIYLSSMCMQCSQRQEEAVIPLVLELQTAVNHQTVIRKQTPVFCKNSHTEPSFQTHEFIIFINRCLLKEFQRAVI